MSNRGYLIAGLLLVLVPCWLSTRLGHPPHLIDVAGMTFIAGWLLFLHALSRRFRG